MKKGIKILLFTTALLLFLQFAKAQRNFDINIYNASFFDINTAAMPEKGEGIFVNYKSTIKKGSSEWYKCKQDAVLKGVEGNILLTALNNEVPGKVSIYFSNPAVGSLTCTVKTEGPFMVEFINGPARNLIPNAFIKITVDTAKVPPVKTWPVKGSSQTKDPIEKIPVAEENIPGIINFDWQVTQRMPKDDEDEKNGKGYKTVTYYFMTDGSYAAIKPDDDDDLSLMVYSPIGNTWMFNDEKKTITVMNMVKTVGEGGIMGNKIAEDINKGPLKKQNDKAEKFIVTKKGKTKKILGVWTAEEFEIENKNIIKTASVSASYYNWYIKVPFDPVKIYTMGAGRPADISKLQNDPRYKNSVFAIPILNKNYLWAETDACGLTGLQTIEIKHVNNTIRTAGYTIKTMHSLKMH